MISRAARVILPLVVLLCTACGGGKMEPCCADLNGQWGLAYKDVAGVIRRAEVEVVQTEKNLEGKGVLHPAEVTRMVEEGAKASPAPQDINVVLKGTRDGANVKWTLVESKGQAQLFSGEGEIDSVHERGTKDPYRVHMAGKGSLPDNKVVDWESML